MVREYSRLLCASKGGWKDCRFPPFLGGDAAHEVPAEGVPGIDPGTWCSTRSIRRSCSSLTAGSRPAASLKNMQTQVFEETRPDDYLMRAAASDLGKAYKQIAAGEMAIRPGDVVLDLGCGPGADLPAFAEAAGEGGRVLGIDHDPDAVSQARERTRPLPQVEVGEGDIRSLAVPAASADKAHTDRVLQHVPDLAAALAEARRVLREGGTAVFAEPDWDTLVIDYPDLATARAYTRYITDHVIRNPAIGRQPPASPPRPASAS